MIYDNVATLGTYQEGCCFIGTILCRIASSTPKDSAANNLDAETGAILPTIVLLAGAMMLGRRHTYNVRNRGSYWATLEPDTIS